MPATLENSAVATELENVRFHSNPKERQCQRMSKLHTILFISHASKIVLKILQAGLQEYMEQELTDVQAGFRNGRGTRDQIADIHWIIEIQENSRKKMYSDSLTTLKPLTVWITTNKASGGDGISVQLFQILKDDFVTVLHSICQKIWKPQQWPQDWKRSVFIPIPKRQCHRMFILPYNCTHFTC